MNLNEEFSYIFYTFFIKPPWNEWKTSLSPGPLKIITYAVCIDIQLGMKVNKAQLDLCPVKLKFS